MTLPSFLDLLYDEHRISILESMKKIFKFLFGYIILFPLAFIGNAIENLRGRGGFGWYEKNNPYEDD